MARYTKSKNKLARRAGMDLGLKTNSVKLSKRLAVLPGQHGKKGMKKMSEYGIQLREKQKIKWIYGVLEKQMLRYYQAATKSKGNSGKELLRLLENRLDNVVYRLGFAPTRAMARQLVSHGHVLVNDGKVNISSYQVKVGDVIKILEKTTKIPAVASMLAEKNINIPAWLEKQGIVGRVKALSERTDVDYDVNENLVVEFYSR